MKLKTFIALFIIGLISACNTRHKHDEELLSKAHDKQLEVIEMIGMLKESIGSSELQSKDSLLTVIEGFEENVFAIPGYHLELLGHEDHDHSHSKVELTDQDIYDIQIQMLKELEEMEAFITSK